jgi:hypothetical protein
MKFFDSLGHVPILIPAAFNSVLRSLHRHQKASVTGALRTWRRKFGISRGSDQGRSEEMSMAVCVIRAEGNPKSIAVEPPSNQFANLLHVASSA